MILQSLHGFGRLKEFDAGVSTPMRQVARNHGKRMAISYGRQPQSIFPQLRRNSADFSKPLNGCAGSVAASSNAYAFTPSPRVTHSIQQAFRPGKQPARSRHTGTRRRSQAGGIDQRGVDAVLLASS
jgi:hypothetical protein